jgi:hypothetical protein
VELETKENSIKSDKQSISKPESHISQPQKLNFEPKDGTFTIVKVLLPLKALIVPSLAYNLFLK